MYLDIALLLLRGVIGGVVLMHGLLKLGLVGKGGSIAGVAGWFNSIGLRPGLFWAYVAVLGEAGGGVLTVLGLGGPIGPGLLAGDLLVVTVVAHWPQGFWAGGGKVGWEFPVPLLAVRVAVRIVALVALLAGVVFFFQGVGVIPGSCSWRWGPSGHLPYVRCKPRRPPSLSSFERNS